MGPVICLIIVSALCPCLSSVRYQVRPGQGQKKVSGGWGGVVCLIIVSALGPGLSKVKC